MIQLSYKGQICICQILSHPVVNTSVQLWFKVIFPVARFTFRINLMLKNKWSV